MFPGIEEGMWTFTKIREARDGEKEDLLAQAKGLQIADDDADQADEDEDDDEEEGEVKDGEAKDDEAKEESAPVAPDSKDDPSTQEDVPDDMDDDMADGLYVEDEDDEEGAVWCLTEGKVTDWGCFFALLYANTISSPPTTPDGS